MSAPAPETSEAPTEKVDAAAAHAPVPHEGGRTWAGYLGMPLFLAAVLAVLYLYVAAQDMGATAGNILNRETITSSLIEHIQLAVLSTFFVILIAVPTGVLLTRHFARRITGPVLAVFNTGQAVPSIGVLALLAAVFQFIGFRAAVLGLVIYASLSVLRNTMVGLTQVDETVLESARGMGMTRLAVLLRIELPLAVPIILAGIRTALVINVGTATLAAFISGGGLGRIIVGGIVSLRPTVTLTGAVLAATLALLIDHLAGIAEDVLRPRGL